MVALSSLSCKYCVITKKKGLVCRFSSLSQCLSEHDLKSMHDFGVVETISFILFPRVSACTL